MPFWQWWSLNRDAPTDAECPGWQWWYYELGGYEFPEAKVQKQLVFRNYRKFPLIRSALDMRFRNAEGEITEFIPIEYESNNVAS